MGQPLHAPRGTAGAGVARDCSPRTCRPPPRRRSDAVRLGGREEAVGRTRPMNVRLSSDAEEDLTDGFWFYEEQEAGLGSYFRSSVLADIEALRLYGGIHPRVLATTARCARRFRSPSTTGWKTKRPSQCSPSSANAGIQRGSGSGSAETLARMNGSRLPCRNPLIRLPCGS